MGNISMKNGDCKGCSPYAHPSMCWRMSDGSGELPSVSMIRVGLKAVNSFSFLETCWSCFSNYREWGDLGPVVKGDVRADQKSEFLRRKQVNGEKRENVRFGLR